MIPKLSCPIVLVHGLFGFDRFKVAGLTVARYFPGIVESLEAAGNRVLVPSLSPTGGVADRAAQLRAFIDRAAPSEPVHLLAHSMGGLDARYMISKLGMAQRVLSLTTLGTPHRGTAFADWGIRRIERVARPFFDLFDIPRQAFYDLTTEECRKFNENVLDDAGVRYFSVAGRHDGSFMNPEWLLPYNIVYFAEGPNDGVVSVASASYGENVDVWEGDHFSLVNWLSPRNVVSWLSRDPARRYGPLLCRLRDEGF